VTEAGGVDELRARLSRVADGLYRIDAEPECRLLRDPSSLEGVSASLAESVADAFDRIWTEYPALTAAVDEAPGDKSSLLTTDVPDRIRRLDGDVLRILDAAKQIADAWRTALPRADQLRETLAAVEEDARTIGMADDPRMVNARRLVEHLGRQVARDPMSVDPQPATTAVVEIAEVVSELVSLHASLSADLVSARELLDEIVVTIDDGREALARSHDRVKNPKGLLEPLDAAALDDGDLALRPWLVRIEDEARAGRWLAAARGLQRWRTVADGWRHNAQRVVEANRSPVEQRDQLRGLFDAYRAKAAATGRAEDRTLTDAAQAARAALYTAPCDLEEAERLVHDYARLVSATP
jgi:hypothetical protein